MNLSPRARRIAGWGAAVALVLGIAIGVRFVGDTGDGSTGIAATSSPEAAAAQITYGTALDPATGLVATAARTSRFAADEPFAYSTDAVPPTPTVFVEVERLGPEGADLVQARAGQTLPAGATATAFEVPPGVLHEAFGPGEYRMRIYLLIGDERPAAEGTFVLEAASPSPAAPG